MNSALNWAWGKPLLDGRYAGYVGGKPFFVGMFREKGD